MEVGDLYSFVLLIVIVGIVLGIGILVLDRFGGAAGVGSTASQAINDTRDALTPIATTWIPIIVIVAVAAIILGLVMKSFAGGGRR